MSTFIRYLRSPCYITKLQVKGNDIHGSTLSFLADGLDSGKILNDDEFDSGFCLDDNPLGLEGTVTIGRILSGGHYQSKSLLLSRCQLAVTVEKYGNVDINLQNTPTGVGQHLTQIPQSSTIIDLKLDGNCFSGEGIHILSGFFHLCPNLESLSSKECQISSDDLQQLFRQLQVTKLSSFLTPCSKLQYWCLDNNNIDDRGILSLMNHLSSLFPRLGDGVGGVFFDQSFTSNPISYDVIKRFVEINERHSVSNSV